MNNRNLCCPYVWKREVSDNKKCIEGLGEPEVCSNKTNPRKRNMSEKYYQITSIYQNQVEIIEKENILVER